MSLPPESHLNDIAAELDRCNKCGFCQAACPTYQATGFEWLVTRGRVSLIQDVAAGAMDLFDPGLTEAIDSCLVCGACIAACPPQIRIHDLIYATRRERVRQRGLSWLEKAIYRGILPRPAVLRLLVKFAAAGERVGLRDWLGRSRLLRRWPGVKRAINVGPRLSGKTGRALIGAVPKLAQPRAKVAYFLACTKEFIYPGAASATVQVLAANQVDVVIPPAVCCGLPCQSAGDLEGARALARKNLGYLRGLDVDAILMDEGSCAAHLLDYPDLLAGTPDEAAARALKAKVLDLATFLDRLGMVTPGRVNARVTWHDPCSLKHYMGVAAAPRRLLKAIPGVQFAEAALADTCCGGAGAYIIKQPDLSDKILDMKMAGFTATGADFIVTTSPSCIMQLERGVSERGVRSRVLYLSEFLAMAYAAGNQCEE